MTLAGQLAITVAGESVTGPMLRLELRSPGQREPTGAGSPPGRVQMADQARAFYATALPTGEINRSR